MGEIVWQGPTLCSRWWCLAACHLSAVVAIVCLEKWGGGHCRETCLLNLINQGDSLRSHLTWLDASGTYAYTSCIWARSWRFNGLISLGRILPLCVSAIILSTVWSCYIMMSLHYLSLCTLQSVSLSKIRPVIWPNPLKEGAVKLIKLLIT